MAEVLLKTFSYVISWKGIFFDKILLKFVPGGQNNNNAVFVEIMAGHWTGDKPLPEPMMTYHKTSNIRHILVGNKLLITQM